MKSRPGIARFIILLPILLFAEQLEADVDSSADPLPEANIEIGNPRDRDGLWRDTKYFLGYQVATIGILYLMPESVSGWSDEQKEEYDLGIWWDNVTHPQTDTDDFFINCVLHPYWGAAYFVRARERGYNMGEGFAYSALMSSLYEFGVEALFENASKQDLWVTPVIGSMVGTYFWHLRGYIQERDIERGFRSTGDKWLWVLTDPLGALNRQVDTWFGQDAQLQLAPYRQQATVCHARCEDSRLAEEDAIYGIELRFRWH